jgi:hypothetical protein
MGDWAVAGAWTRETEASGAKTVEDQTHARKWVGPVCTSCAVALTLAVAAVCIGLLGIAVYLFAEQYLQAWSLQRILF